MMDEYQLPSARGGRRVAQPLQLEVVRPLGADDLALLEAPPPVGSETRAIAELRSTHHSLAQVLAKGHTNEEAALITGYSPSRISILRSDPAFAELLVHYQTLRELVYVDVLERMKVLGLSTLEELQSRLENRPEGFSARELMEMTELLLMKGRTGVNGAAGGDRGPVQGMLPVINVSFVSADPKGKLVIDGTVE